MNVVHRRSWTNKSIGAEYLFRIQYTIGASELDMSFRWNIAECCVVRHGAYTLTDIPLKVASSILFNFKSFKERFKVAFAKGLAPTSADNFEE